MKIYNQEKGKYCVRLRKNDDNREPERQEKINREKREKIPFSLYTLAQRKYQI